MLDPRPATLAEDGSVVDVAFAQLGSRRSSRTTEIDRRMCHWLEVLDVQHANPLRILPHVLHPARPCNRPPPAVDLEVHHLWISLLKQHFIAGLPGPYLFKLEVVVVIRILQARVFCT